MKLLIVLILVGILCANCTSESFPEVTHLGPIPFPDDNPSNLEKIQLGEKLFFDKRLSKNNEIACATCHKPELAFTDGLKKSKGVEGRQAFRNAPSLLNSAYFKRYMYDGEVKSLEEQALVPITDFHEMGSTMKSVVEKLSQDKEYQQKAQSIFGRPIDPYVITRSLAAFQRTLLSVSSRFDRFYLGDRTALSPSEKRGYKLFKEKLYCTSCHPAPHFTTYSVANNGLYIDYGIDQGRYRVDGKETSKGLFKIPSLRNCELTAPYMHDGSMETLEEVVSHYSHGGQKHVNQSKLIQPFELTSSETRDLIHFLKSLTER